MIDPALIARLKRGEESAFREIYDLHFSKLFRYALTFTHSRETAEEVVQEVFLTLWRKRAEVDPERSLNHYLYTLTKHRCFRYLQQAARREDLRRQLVYRTQTDHTPEDDVIYDQSYAIAREAIEQLPARRRVIYEMARLEGRSAREIAEELNLSVSTVKNQLLNASHAVKSYFRAHADDVVSALLVLMALLAA